MLKGLHIAAAATLLVTSAFAQMPTQTDELSIANMRLNGISNLLQACEADQRRVITSLHQENAKLMEETARLNARIQEMEAKLPKDDPAK